MFQNIGQLVKIIRRKLVDIACTLQNIYTKSADVLNLLKRKEKKCQLFQEDKNLTSPRYPVRNRKQTIFYGVNGISCWLMFFKLKRFLDKLYSA